MKPFPAPCLAVATVFVPSASNPTMGSNVTLVLFGRRSYFNGTFLLEDGWLWSIPLRTWPPSFHLAACDLIVARLLAVSISAKVDGCTSSPSKGI